MPTAPNLAETVTKLRDHWAQIAAFGVVHLDLVGSVARNEAAPESDVDCIAEFAGAVRFRQFMGLAAFLEDRLGRKVDLMTPETAHPKLRAIFAAEAVRVA